MPLLPALRSLFHTINSGGLTSEDIPIAQAREFAHVAMEKYVVGYYGEANPLPLEMDHQVPVENGQIQVRVYTISEGGQRSPCHLYIHGGGFWLGTLNHFDVICRRLAHEAACTVISVDYRLAPEHKFPKAAEDCYAALLWTVEHAESLQIDPARITVGGLSAGGNLAAVTALMARDRGGPTLALQVLEAPVLDLTNWKPLELPADGITVQSGKDVYCQHYLNSSSDARLPYVSPLLETDLSGLPPALVMCAEFDPLCAEGKAYAERLAQAKVRAPYHCWKGHFHGSQYMVDLVPEEAHSYLATIATAIRQI